jgi:indole-3-glycerol phosphate synthase
MTTILDRIIEKKKHEVEQLKREAIETQVRSTYSLAEQLKNEKKLTIISEIKRASPSKGDLNIHVNVQEQAKRYEQLGAGAISVLTDTPFFKGSFEDLRQVRVVTNIPLLCKDFIIDEVQIRKARAAGADVILLIVAALSRERLAELYQYAKSLDLDVIVEVHNEEELEAALTINPQIIGVNNRNLKTFEVTLETTERLARKIKEAGVLLISESGIQSKEDAVRVKEAGANGILVGEAFMKADSLGTLFAALQV